MSNNSDSLNQDSSKPPKKQSNAALHIVWWGGWALVALLVYGALTGQLFGESNRECYPYKQPNGEWATTCDDG